MSLRTNCCRKGIEDNNPGSRAILEMTSESKYKHIFIYYSASAEGFRNCRPLIGLDGTHLKNKYQGILLSATAVDAVGQLFPLSYAIVNAENDENWSWFLSILKSIIHDNMPTFLTPNMLTILSDRQKGLIDSVNRHFPNSANGYCLRHLEANFHKVFKNIELKTFIWRAAGAKDQAKYDKAMESM